MDHEKCLESYGNNFITENKYCAGTGIVDSCHLDSGGPGLIHGKSVGIISSGLSCASPVFPGVYTNVYSISYYSYIINI